MEALVVQVLLKGELLQTLHVDGDTLRVGRMRENEVVINNLSVSRFHAVLRREGDGWVIEDLGSENGTHVGGERISGPRRVVPGDDIRVGKHVLVLRHGGSAEGATPGGDRTSSAWNAADTYLAGPETQARMFEAGLGKEEAVRATEPLKEPETRLVDAPASELEPAVPVGAADAVPPGEPPTAARPGEHTALFDFAMEDDLARSDPGVAMDLSEAMPVSPSAPSTPAASQPEASPAQPEPLAEPAPDAAAPQAPLPESAGLPETLVPESMDLPGDELPEAPMAGTQHAGLIVQREGNLERVLPWEGERLCAGRARECEITLGSAKVSRRHALFVREGGHYEVRDLDSVSGIFVNGERVLAHRLQLGDVVRIEDFELTFLLDQQPIAESVQPSLAGQRSSDRADPQAATQLGVEDPTRPPVEPPQTDPGALSAPPSLRVTDPMPEIDLLGSGGDELDEEEKELTTAPPAAQEQAAAETPTVLSVSGLEPEILVDSAPEMAAASQAQVEAGAKARPLVLELRIPAEGVPQAVREWLEEQLGQGRLPVELRLRDEDRSGD